MVTQALPWAIGWCIAVPMGILRSPFLTLPTTACCFLAASVVCILSATHGFIATRLVKSNNEMISCDSIEFLDFLETLSPFWPKRCQCINDPETWKTCCSIITKRYLSELGRFGQTLPPPELDASQDPGKNGEI